MAVPNTPAAASDSPRREGGYPPERFDRIRYEDLSDEELWNRIGKGSFGNVYKGEYLGIEVAIKEVLPSTEYDVEKYLSREIALMQQARHPNVVQYLGLCLAPPAPDANSSDNGNATAADSKRILIISEFLPRGNLRQYILDRSLPFPWRLRISFATDIARALAYLHARNTMHRDLKGENLLVTDNERLKACDFGLARVAAQIGNGQSDGGGGSNGPNEARKPSDMYTYCGTDGYMSPEILLGLPFDLRTDIYSLGILYIEIASRQLASQSTFVRRPPDYSLSHDEVWSSVSSVCPRSFVELALECCDANPDVRPDCKAILHRLQGIEEEVKELEARGLGDEDAHTRGGAAGKASSCNVGSISFAGTFKVGSKLQPRRPVAPRLPSFEGAIDLKKGSTFAPALAAAAGPSRLEADMAHTSSKEGPAAGPKADEDADDGEAVLVLANVEVSIDSESAIFAHQEEDEYSPSLLQPDHFGTPYGALGRTSGSQLPTSSGTDCLGSSSEEIGTVTVLAPVKVQVPLIQQNSSILMAQGMILSSVEAAVDFKDADEDADVFHSAFQEPPALTIDKSDGPKLPATEVAHRFSLIKPGLQRFLSSFAAVHYGSTSRGRLCAHCAKPFGFTKAYLACDDCGLASHIKCSDAVPLTCSET
ncbi:hypothetical protein JCM3774_001890 [Rhodotorula dairenensis]